MMNVSPGTAALTHTEKLKCSTFTPTLMPS